MLLDKQAALERIENDEELYHEICDIFRDDAPEIIARLKSAVCSGDLAAATRHAHSLKSSAANIGASDLSDAAKVTESALSTGDRAQYDLLLARLDEMLAAVLTALAQTNQ